MPFPLFMLVRLTHSLSVRNSFSSPLHAKRGQLSRSTLLGYVGHRVGICFGAAPCKKNPKQPRGTPHLAVPKGNQLSRKAINTARQQRQRHDDVPITGLIDGKGTAAAAMPLRSRFNHSKPLKCPPTSGRETDA